MSIEITHKSYTITFREDTEEWSGFDQKRYTNPSMMNDALRSIGRPWRKIGKDWPIYGLARVQWEGPWTAPGVPMRVRYRHTHWIGVDHADDGARGIFDINAMNNGTGWVSFSEWWGILVPWLLEQCEPGASGIWHLTHAIEVQRP